MSSGTSEPLVLVTPRALTKNPDKVTELLHARGLKPVFSEPGVQPKPEELKELLSGCVGWIAGVEHIDASVLASARDLQVLSRFGTGTSNVDLLAARHQGVAVRAAAGANAQSVAELAVGLTMDCLRGISLSSAVVKASGWQRHLGRELSGLVVAVVGYGAIGRIYADLMRRLGASPVVFDPMLPEKTLMPEGITRASSLVDAVEVAEVLSFHCPPSAKPLFDQELLARCRPGLIVINTARSELIDDQAMLSGLVTGEVSAYGVDAFDTEPPEPSRLLAHPHVIATPHLGAFTQEAIERTLETAVDNVVSSLQTVHELKEVVFSGALKDQLENDMNGATLRCHWLGQAGFLIRTSSGLSILIDPYLSDSLAEKYKGSVFPHVRMMAAPINPDSFPRVDLVLITHGHTDHMDPGTISVIAQRHPDAVFVCPERAREVALDRGVPPERLIGALGGETLEPSPGIRIFPIPSAHEELDITAEGSAFLGYVIDMNGERIYHSGDCAPYDELVHHLQEHSPTLALLPVNGRDDYRRKNGVPGNFTLDEALSLCERAGIPTMVAHHWGMFDFNTISLDKLREVWQEYSGPTSWYIPTPLGFLERRPAFTRGQSA